MMTEEKDVASNAEEKVTFRETAQENVAEAVIEAAEDHIQAILTGIDAGHHEEEIEEGEVFLLIESHEEETGGVQVATKDTQHLPLLEEKKGAVLIAEGAVATKTELSSAFLRMRTRLNTAESTLQTVTLCDHPQHRSRTLSD